MSLLALSTATIGFGREVRLTGNYSADNSDPNHVILTCGDRSERCGEYFTESRTFRDANNHLWTNVDCDDCGIAPTPLDPTYEAYENSLIDAFYTGGISVTW
jgi:hypothetical protein